MGRLPLEERRKLAATLKSKPQDLKIVAAVVERLETCGAISDCQTQAEDVIERAWERAEPVLPDTIPKVMLRAFGWYALQRHY